MTICEEKIIKVVFSSCPEGSECKEHWAGPYPSVIFVVNEQYREKILLAPTLVKFAIALKRNNAHWKINSAFCVLSICLSDKLLLYLTLRPLCLPARLSAVCPPVMCVSSVLSVWLSVLSIFLSVCLFVCLYVVLSVCLSVYLVFLFCLSVLSVSPW